jgi:hypothetical protein
MHREIKPVDFRLDSPKGDKRFNAEVMEPEWFDIHTRIEHGDIEGERLLRSLTFSGLRLILRRGSSRNIEQLVDDTLIGTVEAIRSGKLHGAMDIPSFLLKEGRRRLLEQPAAPPSGNGPEDQKAPISGQLKGYLARLTPIESKMLHRYYVLRQEPAFISAEMGVVPSVLAELISRAKQISRVNAKD